MGVVNLYIADTDMCPLYIEMTPQEWIGITDNPRQRNTERHLKNASHLLNPSPTHAHVAMAISTVTKESWKLDGHTRALYWQLHPEKAPPKIYVTCYYVRSKEEAGELYTHFDNQKATESSIDRVYGAFREAEFSPQSAPLKRGKLVQALIYAEYLFSGKSYDNSEKRQQAAYLLIPEWLEELRALDAIGPLSSKFNAVYVAAALLTLRKHKNEAEEFWRLYNEDKGIKLENEIDAVEMINRIFKNEKLKGAKLQERVVKRVISAFEFWRKGRSYSSRSTGPKSTNTNPYFKK